MFTNTLECVNLNSMATIVTSQLISRYYSEYQKTELTFSKEIIKTLAMDPRQVYIKCSGSQWPCIINSASYSLARIVIGIKGGAYQVVSKKDPPAVSIRFAFYQNDGQLMSFFVSGKVTEITQYMNSSDLAIVTVTYNQRPPDDMIEMMGKILDANANSKTRKNDRVVITPDSLRKLGIPRKETVAVLQNVPRHCILQELSFSGAKIVLLGLAQFLVNKEIALKLEFDEPHEAIPLQGIVTGTLPVEGRKDIVIANIQFTEGTIPLSYKIHINTYLTTVLKKDMNTVFAGDNAAAKPVAQKPAAPQAAAQPAQQQNQAQAQNAEAPATATTAAPAAQAQETKPAEAAAQQSAPATTQEGTKPAETPAQTTEAK